MTLLLLCKSKIFNNPLIPYKFIYLFLDTYEKNNFISWMMPSTLLNKIEQVSSHKIKACKLKKTLICQLKCRTIQDDVREIN